MNKYAKVAIEVAEELKNMKKEEQKKIDLGDLWKGKCKESELKEASIKKECQRLAFVGLGENELIKGIRVKNSYKKSLNKNYAVEAVKILRDNKKNYTTRELWKEIGNKDKKHNNQMNVVIVLWEEGMIK